MSNSVATTECNFTFYTDKSSLIASFGLIERAFTTAIRVLSLFFNVIEFNCNCNIVQFQKVLLEIEK